MENLSIRAGSIVCGVLRYLIPGLGTIEIAHVVCDLNGTLTDRGVLLDGLEERIARLKQEVDVVIASADTFGTLAAVARTLDVRTVTAADAGDKQQLVRELGATTVAVVGNGANDAAAMGEAALALLVLGAEGASVAALSAADIVCRSAVEALDLLLEPRGLVATLRR